MTLFQRLRNNVLIFICKKKHYYKRYDYLIQGRYYYCSDCAKALGFMK